MTVIVDPVSGRPTAQIDGVTANYQLVEIATGKIVLEGHRVRACRLRYRPVRSSASPCSAPQRDAEDRAVQGRRRGDPQPAGVVFRRRNLVSYYGGLDPRIEIIPWSRQTAMSTPLSRGPIRRGRSCWCSARTPAWSASASTRWSRRRSTIVERPVRAGAARRRGSGRRSVPAGRGSADHAAVRRPPRGLGEGRRPQYRAGGRGAARRSPPPHAASSSKPAICAATRRCALCANAPRMPRRCPATPTASATGRG